MSNKLRVVYNNTANSGVVTASSTSGSLVASNLLTDSKADTWRATGTTATITTTYTVSQFVSMVALPFCNLTSAATFRVKCYTNSGDVTPVLDTGVVLAAAPSPLALWDWGNVPLGVNSYSYGGASYGVVWFTTQAVKKVELIISDPTNPSGYIEASRLVMGAYWSPENDAELSPQWIPVEDSSHERSDAGDLRTDIGTLNKKLQLTLPAMSVADRNSMMNILRGNGMSRPIYLSLFPQDSDSSSEQAFQVYGKLATQPSVTLSNWNLYSTTIEIEEA
jgi:hypothetical protein